MPASDIPRDRGPDSTLALLAEGYAFISNRCRVHQSDVFRTRLMMQEAFCMMGEEATRVFYEPGRFTRRRAMPPTALALLQDRESVALLDGEAHRHRKGMFLSVLAQARVGSLADAFDDEWRARQARWARAGRVVLLDEAREVLFRAACRWMGVPVTDAEVRERARELGAMVEGAGSIGPRNWHALMLRTRTERWAQDVVMRARADGLDTPADAPVRALAEHRDLSGELLEPEVAGVELVNILRPTVAVDRYVVFAALALHEHPETRGRVREERYRHWFTQEVRRFYPFFPFVAGRVLAEFEWRGHRFKKGTWVVLDLYGTNRDPRAWDDPDAFRPERFEWWDGSPFDFIPQGGGDHAQGHRCAGEWATIELVDRAVRLLSEMRYDVPSQDLRIDLSRMPAAPASGFVIRDVRAVEAPPVA